MTWYRDDGPQGQTVISSRIRLARNLRDEAFPNRLESRDRGRVNQRIRDSFMSGNDKMPELYLDVRLGELSPIDRGALFEKRLISADLAESREPVEALIRKDESVSIMLGEEDHIRVQAMAAGFDLETAYAEALKAALLLEEALPVAYDEDLGFLTACPTNVGTGMRASLMVHLPALTELERIEALAKRLAERGLTIRGALGEGSRAYGRLYQISNQITLGLSEEDLIEDLKRAAGSVIEMEQEAGRKMLRANRLRLEDRLYRSAALLRSARLLTQEEAENGLSDLRWAIALGLVPMEAAGELANVSADIGRAQIQKSAGRPLEAGERDKLRADRMRAAMRKIFNDYENHSEETR